MISAIVDPPKMQIANVELGTSIEAQFNPTELDENLEALYNRLQVIGQSHQPMQYLGTGNHQFSFELAFRAIDNQGHSLLDQVMARRNYILSLMYATRTGNGSPPRVLFVWPGLAALTCKVTTFKGKHTFFNKKAYPVYGAYQIGVEEIRDVRLYSEDVLKTGTIRPATALTSAQTSALNA